MDVIIILFNFISILLLVIILKVLIYMVTIFTIIINFIITNFFHRFIIILALNFNFVIFVI